jgi:glycosyltransferase involved in cell wall biosynthesis
MRILLTSEARFERTPDGTIWGPAACGTALWNRYLEVFSAVLVAARVRDVPKPSDGCIPASAPRIAFCALPPYAGLSGFLVHGRAVRSAVADAVRGCEAVVVRSPSPIGSFAARTATALKKPYGAEIVGDPELVFSAGGFRHPLRVLIGAAAITAQVHVSRHASAAIFVTTRFLQSKYPTGGQTFAASDAALDDAAFDIARPRQRHASDGLRLITVTALDQPYKGTAVLLDALRHLRGWQAPVDLRIVGTGRLLPALRERARALGVESHVEFLGQLDRSGVQHALDGADLFVLPSLQEGLPRALLEAMARGLPAVATDVGGNSELLPADCLVPARDARALAHKIREVSADDRLRSRGERNEQVARHYHERVLAPVRRAFLLAVRDASTARQKECACA